MLTTYHNIAIPKPIKKFWRRLLTVLRQNTKILSRSSLTSLTQPPPPPMTVNDDMASEADLKGSNCSNDVAAAANNNHHKVPSSEKQNDNSEEQTPQTSSSSSSLSKRSADNHNDDVVVVDSFVRLTIKWPNPDKDMDSSEGPVNTMQPLKTRSNNNNNNNYSYNLSSMKHSGQQLKDRKIVGLRNLGNTCYANSCLQALYLTNKFRENVMRRPDYGPIHTVLSKLFAQMDKCGTQLIMPTNSTSNGAAPKFQTIKPDTFIHEFRSLKPQFVKNEQHDAQEFLSILLECVHQEANRVARNSRKQIPDINARCSKDAWDFHLANIDNSYYSRLFVGQLESSLKCLTCNHTSLSWSCFWQLPLHLKDTNDDETTLSIDDCLKEYTSTEILTDDCAPLCEKCNQKRTSSKKQTICRMPHYLIVHLKRFTHTGSKISRKVIINPRLMMCDKQFANYACVLHRGTETKGHYFTLFDNSTEWILFDDETIYSNLSQEQVEPILQSHSYICFYKAISQTSRI